MNNSRITTDLLSPHDMRHLRHAAVFALVSGLTGATMAQGYRPAPNSVLTPARQTTTHGPVGQQLVPPPDLSVESLTKEDMGGNHYKLRAVVRNVGTLPYPGGGSLLISREGVGVPLPSAPGTGLAINELGKKLSQTPIPKLDAKQTFQVEVKSDGRGLFSARASAIKQSGDVSAWGSPDKNAANDSKTLDLLLARTQILNSAGLNIALAKQLAGAKIRLDWDNSYIDVPGITKTTWKIPIWTKDITPALEARYRVNNINSKALAVDYHAGKLRLCVDFETDGPEVYGAGTGPNDLWPDINANHIKVCASMAGTYKSTAQYISLVPHHVDVDADWHFNTDVPVLKQFLNAKLDGVNEEIKTRLMEVLGKLAGPLSLALNDHLRKAFLIDEFGNLGRITGVQFEEDRIRIDMQTPKG